MDSKMNNDQHELTIH